MSCFSRLVGYKTPLAGDGLVYVIIVVCALLMIPHLGGAYGGFHGMNEAHYAQLGESVMREPLSYPVRLDGETDYNFLPVTAYLIGLSFRIFGVSEWSSRVVPVLFSLLSVYMTFRIGKILYDRRTGLIAAAILAVTPMNVLVGRNVQTEAVFISLGLVALYLYIRGGRISAGFVLGLACLAKQPAILFYFGILAVEILKNKRVNRGFCVLTVGFLLTVAPYIIYSLSVNSSSFLGGQASRIMLSVSSEGSRKGLQTVFSEVFWGLSPLIAVAFMAGCAAMALKRRLEVPVVYAIVFLAFFIFYNKHGYYILPLAPFAAMIIANAVSDIKWKKIAILAVAVLLLSGAFYSIIMLCASKYGFEEYKRLTNLYEQENAQFLTGSIISGSYMDQVRYYNPNVEMVELDKMRLGEGEMIPLDYGRPTYILMHSSEIDLKDYQIEARSEMLKRAAYADKYALVLFGTVFYSAPRNQHFFTLTGLQVVGGLPKTAFGVKKLDEIPGAYLFKLEEGNRLYKRGSGGYDIVA
jgi:hypothetical protein